MSWLPFLGLTALALVLLKAAFDVAGQFQAQRDLAQQEVRRLTALVESRTQQLGQWMTRADQAERRLEELWMEHCEDAARKQHSFEIISERTKAIDAARAKCGPDFTGIAGTERDPVYLTRPNIRHDDVAYVATIAELCGGEGAGA